TAFSTLSIPTFSGASTSTVTGKSREEDRTATCALICLSHSVNLASAGGFTPLTAQLVECERSQLRRCSSQESLDSRGRDTHFDTCSCPHSPHFIRLLPTSTTTSVFIQQPRSVPHPAAYPHCRPVGRAPGLSRRTPPGRLCRAP